MLVLTNCVGFGVKTLPEFEVLAMASQANTDTPTFSVDLGQATKDRVIVVAFAMHDDDVSDGFTVTATLDGDAMTELEDAGHFDGANTTVAASLYMIQTDKGGTLDIVATAAGFTGTIDTTSIVVYGLRGFNPTATDSASSIPSTAGGDDLDLDTSAGDIAFISGIDLTASPGALSGGGNPITIVQGSEWSHGYDRSPLGGATDTYDFSGDTEVIVGAVFARL